MAEKTLKTDDESLATRGVSLFSRAKGSWEVVRERWRKDNDLYNGRFSREEAAISKLLGVPRLFIQKTYAQVQRILADCMDTVYFDPDELVSLVTNKAVPAESLEVFKNLLNHRLRGCPITYYEECYEAYLDAIKNKYCVIKVYPRIKMKKTPKLSVIHETEHPIVLEEFDETIEAFSPVFETLPYEDVFFSPEATWKDYWRFPIIHRKKVTRAYCRDRGYKNVDDLGRASSSGLTDEVKQQRALEDGSEQGQEALGNSELDNLWIYEIWDFKRKDGTMESGSFVMGSSSSEMPEALFRSWEWNELPYRFDEMEPIRPPFSVGVAAPESHKLAGKSFPEVSEGLQKETNAQRNQEREAVARALRPPMLVDKNSGIDLYALMVRKIGAVVQSDNGAGPDVARELLSQNPIPLTAPSQQRTDNDYAEITSITPAQLGVQKRASETATAFAGIDANANKKIKMVIRNVLITGILPALRMLMKLEQAYETNEYIERVTGTRLGKRFLRLPNGSYQGASPIATIQGNYDFEINTGVNKQGQMGQWRGVIELINQANIMSGQLISSGVIPPGQVQFFSPNVAIEQMMKVLGQKNLDEMKIQAQQPPPEAQGAQGQPSPPSISGPTLPAQEAFLG